METFGFLLFFGCVIGISFLIINTIEWQTEKDWKMRWYHPKCGHIEKRGWVPPAEVCPKCGELEPEIYCVPARATFFGWQINKESLNKVKNK